MAFSGEQSEQKQGQMIGELRCRHKYRPTFLLFYYILDMGIVGTFIRSKSESCEPYWYRILYPYLLHPFKNIALTSSIFMVVAISAERHRAIVDPLNHRPTFWPYLFWVLVISGSSLTSMLFIIIWHG